MLKEKKSFCILNGGFTLAEVLITLAIIGVVAALTIPAIVKNYRASELKTQFKKAYSILNQITARMNLEEGIVISKVSAQTFAGIFKKYSKMYKDCGLASCLYTNNNLEKYRTYAKKLNIVPYYNYWDDGQLILQNGMLIMIENAYYNEELHQTMLSIDINGMEKGPNAWGQDVFTFQVMDNGKLVPMGAPGTGYTNTANYCSKTSTNTLNGIACTYKAMTDEDYFKNLP